MAQAYIFFGKAGSGKGTQAQNLKQHLEEQGKKVIYIETGNLFREITKTDSLIAQLTNEVIGHGGLMPVFFPVYLWSDILIKNFTGEEEIIFDGVARRIPEAEALDSALTFFKFEKKFVFPIEISDATAHERLKIRNQGRHDDALPENIQKRLDWYQENVLPVLDYFKKNLGYTFSPIDGEVTVPEVFEQIKVLLR